MPHATFDDQFLQQLDAANIKPKQMGEYKTPISFPFAPVKERTRKGIMLNGTEGLQIANDVETMAAFLRGKQMNSSLLAPQAELVENGILDMSRIQDWLKRVPNTAHPTLMLQGSLLPEEFEDTQEFEQVLLEHIFGEVPFIIGNAPDESGIGKMRVARRIEGDERFQYEGPKTSFDYFMEQQAEQLADALMLEFLEVLFHVGNTAVKPFALNTRPDVPDDIELIKRIMRLATQ